MGRTSGVLVSACLLLAGCGLTPETGQQGSSLPPQTEATNAPATSATAEAPTSTNGGDTTEAGQAIPGIGSPCDIATPAMVEQAFQAFDPSLERGVEGYAQNCSYWLGGGLVQKVDVFYVGAADHWDQIKSDWDEKGGGTVDVDGVGDGAFHPNVFHGVRDLVFKVDDHVFSIVVLGGPTDNEVLSQVESAVKGLADAIVAHHS